MRLREKITTIIFILLIGIVPLGNLLIADRTYSQNENRLLAQKPKITLPALLKGNFSKDYEEYVTDQIIFRDTFVKVKNFTEVALGKKDNGRVFFGKDGYLIERNTQEDIDNLRVEANISYIKKFINDLEGIIDLEEVTMMLVPTIEAVIPEKLPNYAEVFNQDVLYKKLTKELSKINHLDIRTALREKKDEYIYYRTDHHWTTKGAFIAYREWCSKKGYIPLEEDYIIEKVSEDFLGSTYSKANIFLGEADSIYIYKPTWDMSYNIEYNLGERIGDSLYELKYLNTKDKYRVFLGGNDGIVRIKTSNKNSKSIAVIKDSYANSFIPFLVNDYEMIHVIDLRYNNYSMVKYLQENNIQELLFLYNTIGFAKDRDLIKLTR